jgi:hypothetical protein
MISRVQSNKIRSSEYMMLGEFMCRPMCVYKHSKGTNQIYILSAFPDKVFKTSKSFKFLAFVTPEFCILSNHLFN